MVYKGLRRFKRVKEVSIMLKKNQEGPIKLERVQKGLRKTKKVQIDVKGFKGCLLQFKKFKKFQQGSKRFKKVQDSLRCQGNFAEGVQRREPFKLKQSGQRKPMTARRFKGVQEGTRRFDKDT